MCFSPCNIFAAFCSKFVFAFKIVVFNHKYGLIQMITHSVPLFYGKPNFQAVVLLLLTFCLLLLPLWESVIVLCFAVRYFMSIPVLQSS